MTTGKVGESWTVGRLDGFSGASLIWEVEQGQRGGDHDCRASADK